MSREVWKKLADNNAISVAAGKVIGPVHAGRLIDALRAACAELDRADARCAAADALAKSIADAIADSGGEAISTPVVEALEAWRKACAGGGEGKGL